MPTTFWIVFVQMNCFLIHLSIKTFKKCRLATFYTGCATFRRIHFCYVTLLFVCAIIPTGKICQRRPKYTDVILSLPTTTDDAEGVIGFALREISEGAHPLSYLSTAKLSLDAHAARYAKDEGYRSIVNSAFTTCLGFWKTYVNARLLSLSDDNVIDVNEDDGRSYYERLCAKQAQSNRAVHGAQFSKKTDWKALFAHIDDIEHYAYKLAPHLDPLSKQSDIDILEKAEERAFTITIVDSATPKDEDDV